MSKLKQEQLFGIIIAMEKHHEQPFALTLRYDEFAGWRCAVKHNGYLIQGAFLNDIIGMLKVEKSIAEHLNSLE